MYCAVGKSSMLRLPSTSKRVEAELLDNEEEIYLRVCLGPKDFKHTERLLDE